jgi:hypothetical protein
MAPLAKVADIEKFMPRDFITKDGFGITAKCRCYLTPLIQGEDYPKYRNGLPVYVTLNNVTLQASSRSSRLGSHRPRSLPANYVPISAHFARQLGFPVRHF